MGITEVVPTTSPSMDIQVSSNLERLLFEVNGRDGAAVGAQLDDFRATGYLPPGSGPARLPCQRVGQRPLQ